MRAKGITAMKPFPPSNRGERNVRPDLMIDLSRRLESNKYDPKSNPDGIVDMGSAINNLMQDDLATWVRSNMNMRDFTDSKLSVANKTQDGELIIRPALQYGDTQGSPQLLHAVTRFLNVNFGGDVKPNNVLAANGVTTLLDSLTFNLADDGDVVLLPTPSYGMFAHDLTTRNGVKLVTIPCDDIQRFSETSEHTSILVERLQSAIEKEKDQGRRVAMVLLANPENPLGQCYHSTVLVRILQLCAQHAIHLVVDEIYALTGENAFTSMLSLDLGSNIPNVHILWGLSKVTKIQKITGDAGAVILTNGQDFGLGGLRLGFLITFNEQVYKAMRTLRYETNHQLLHVMKRMFATDSRSMFGWVTSSSAALATKLLSDSKFIKSHYLPKFRRRLEDRRRTIEDYLTSNDIPYSRPNAGLFVFIDLSGWMNNGGPVDDGDKLHELNLLEKMMDHHVFLEPGTVFFATQPGWFRLNYASSDSLFEKGLQNLSHCLSIIDSGPCKQAPKVMTKRMNLCKIFCFR